MKVYITKVIVAVTACMILNLISFGETYSKQINLIDLTEEEDARTFEEKARFFAANLTDLAAFAALSLFPLLFLAAAVGGYLWGNGYHSYSKCDDHYYYDDHGYGSGGGYGHDSYGYKRSDDGRDYDYKHSFQKRSTKSNNEVSGMCNCFFVQ